MLLYVIHICIYTFVCVGVCKQLFQTVVRSAQKAAVVYLDIYIYDINFLLDFIVNFVDVRDYTLYVFCI